MSLSCFSLRRLFLFSSFFGGLLRLLRLRALGFHFDLKLMNVQDLRVSKLEVVLVISVTNNTLPFESKR
jgi:hypothetical protein